MKSPLPRIAQALPSRHHFCRPIHTLHRPSLSAADFVDLSNVTVRRVPCSGSSDKAYIWFYNHEQFPAGTQGFLYYDPVDPDHPASAQVRFRVTHSPDPGNFETGHDLLKSNGRPWALHVANMPWKAWYRPLAELLVKTGLVSRETMEALAAARQMLTSAVQVLTPNKRDFWIDFESKKLSLRVARGTELHMLVLTSPLLDYTRKITPYTGSAICMLEEAKSPSGRAVIQTRVLKIVDPISPVNDNYDGYVPMPKEGELLSFNYGKTPAWRFANDGRSITAGLQHLLTSPDGGHVTHVVSKQGLSSAGIDLGQTSSKASIDTLRSDRLTPSHFMDLSGRINIDVTLTRQPMVTNSRLLYSHLGTAQGSFPLGSHGFLYCYTYWEFPEARFRVTSSEDPGTFAAGHDLLLPNGLPWALNLVQLTKGHATLGKMLISDGLLSPATYDAWERLPHTFISTFHVGQDFALELSAHTRKVHLIHGGRLHHILITNPFHNSRYRRAHLYSGTCLCRFELHEEAHGKPLFVVRVTKIVEPVKCLLPDYDDRVGPPMEGELLGDHRDGETRLVWDLAKISSSSVQP